MNEIKVSVVIPVYNEERFLRQCLDSIQQQTLDHIEVICVDDGSSDNSFKILMEYQEQDSRFIVLQKEHIENSGGGAARNMGLEKATGKYLAFLDADDFFEPDMLEEVYRRAEQAQTQVTIYNSYEWIYDHQTGKETKVKNTQFSPEKDVFSGIDAAEYLFQITGGAAWHGLFLREFILEKEIRFPDSEAFGADDLPFTFGAMALADKITVLDASFLHHRLNTGENQSRKAYIVSLYKAFVKLKETLDKEQLFDVYRCTFSNAAVRRIVNAMNQQGQEQLKEYYEMIRNEISVNLELESYLDLPSDKIYNPEAYQEYKKILQLPFDIYFSWKKKQAMTVLGYKLPEEINDEHLKLILYGAGMYGKYIYEKIQQYHICKILGWVDQNYEKIGFPVQSLQRIKDNNYDYVFIAIINEKVVCEVKKMLLNEGIEESKILILKRN